METNSVLLPLSIVIDGEDMFMREGDAGILSAAQRYIELVNRSSQLAATAEDQMLSGTEGTKYLKRLGHRPLTRDDFKNIITAYGTDEDKQILNDFYKAQVDLRDRLKSTKIIKVILDQSGITQNSYYYRAENPYLWKPEEIVNVMTVLDRIQV